MKTRHLVTTLLLLTVPAVAGPALAQSKRCPRPDAARSADLASLGDLAKLADLAPLQDVAGLAAIADTRELDQLRDLPKVIHDAVRSSARAAAQGAAQARAPRGPEQTERFNKTFRVGHNGTLYLNNTSGDIVIKAGGGEDIVVDAVKRTRQGADAQRQLNAVTVDAVQQAERVEVRTRYQAGSGNIHTSVDFAVTVPSGTALDLHSVSGDVHVSGVKGNLRADCTSGDVRLEDAGQIEVVKVVSGDIKVFGGAGGDVRVSSYSGDVTLRNVKARSLEVSTISGDAKLNDIAADRAAVKTVSGDVDYVGPFAHSGHYEFTAQSGDVRLTPTSDTGFELDARSFAGDVKCDLPLTVKGDVQRHERGRRETRGTFGDGSALITVHTFNGDVVITKK